MLERGVISSVPFFQEFKPLWPRRTETSTLLDQSEFNWRFNVVRLVQEFPQIVNGEVQYFIVGGTAVYIYTDGLTQTRPDLPRRHVPPDVDVVARNKEIVKKLKEYEQCDPRTLGYWIGGRGFTATREIKRRVWESVSTADVLGATVIVANKPALAVTKLTSFKDPETNKFKLPRDKDYEDVIRLGVSLEEIKKEYALWGGSPNRLYIPGHVADSLT